MSHRFVDMFQIISSAYIQPNTVYNNNIMKLTEGIVSRI